MEGKQDEKAAPKTGRVEDGKRARPSNAPSFPRDSLKRTLQLAESIERNNAGRPYDRLTLASSVNYSPNSSGFRILIISSGRYGLTEGGTAADRISLTPLGSKIVAPTSDDQRGQGLGEALLKPDLFRRIYEFYDKKQIPKEELLKNALRKEFGVAPEDIESCHSVLMTNMKDYNLIQNIRGDDYLQLDRLADSSVASLPQQALDASEMGEEKAEESDEATPPLTIQAPKQIFV